MTDAVQAMQSPWTTDTEICVFYQTFLGGHEDVLYNMYCFCTVQCKYIHLDQPPLPSFDVKFKITHTKQFKSNIKFFHNKAFVCLVCTVLYIV